MHSLQVFPGDVGVAGGSGSGWRSTKSQDVGPQGGQPLRAKLRVDEIQVRPNHQHRRVRCPRLEITQRSGSEKQVLRHRRKQEDLKTLHQSALVFFFFLVDSLVHFFLHIYCSYMIINDNFATISFPFPVTKFVFTAIWIIASLLAAFQSFGTEPQQSRAKIFSLTVQFVLLWKFCCR